MAIASTVTALQTIQIDELSFENATKDSVQVIFKIADGVREISVTHDRRFPPIHLFIVTGTTKLTFQEEGKTFAIYSTMTESTFKDYLERIKKTYEEIMIRKPSAEFIEKTIRDVRRTYTVILDS